MTVVDKARPPATRLGILTLAASCLLLCVTPTSRGTAAGLPERLDDRVFWSMVNDFSEPGGYFRSDNLVSNETAFQQVVPALQRLRPASAYVGVGPDQNFTYVVALRPRIAFIVDIRRQNMLLHLLYKALVELAPTRGAFLSRLFSRGRPANAPADASPDTLFAAAEAAPPDVSAFDRNLRDVTRRLTRQHHFTLSDEDLRTVELVYRSFFSAGPDLRYSVGRGSGWMPFPAYRDLMLAYDGDGIRHGYLASEENYRALRDLELRNLIVPLVGDFAGPKALREVAAYLRDHRATVSAFYTSNVEQYLFRGDQWQRFYENVAALPVDEHSTFIRAYFNTFGFRAHALQPPPFASISGPKSVTLLNPITALMAAYNEGRVQSYVDVIELSR